MKISSKLLTPCCCISNISGFGGILMASSADWRAVAVILTGV